MKKNFYIGILLSIAMLPGVSFADMTVFSCINACNQEVPRGCKHCLDTARANLSDFSLGSIPKEEAEAIDTLLGEAAQSIVDAENTTDTEALVTAYNNALGHLNQAEEKIRDMGKYSEKSAYMKIILDMKETVTEKLKPLL